MPGAACSSHPGKLVRRPLMPLTLWVAIRIAASLAYRRIQGNREIEPSLTNVESKSPIVSVIPSTITRLSKSKRHAIPPRMALLISKKPDITFGGVDRSSERVPVFPTIYPILYEHPDYV